jgi:hypothetical protein
MEEPNYLFQAVSNKKFLRSRDLSDPRKGSTLKILQHSEPVGFAFFANSNINAILESIEVDEKALVRNKKPTFQDITLIMEEVFHVHGTREAYPDITADKPDKVAERVAYLNMLTLQEVMKQNKSLSRQQTKYLQILDDPNTTRHRTLPEFTSNKGEKLQESVYYFDPPARQTNWQPMIVESGGSLNGGGVVPLYEAS